MVPERGSEVMVLMSEITKRISHLLLPIIVSWLTHCYQVLRTNTSDLELYCHQCISISVGYLTGLRNFALGTESGPPRNHKYEATKKLYRCSIPWFGELRSTSAARAFNEWAAKPCAQKSTKTPQI
jgi:hypothetical protein